MYIITLKDKSRHEAATEPKQEGDLLVVRQDGIALFKAPMSQVTSITYSDGEPDPGPILVR